MRTAILIVFAFFVVGCSTTRPHARLTPHQAEAKALELANRKASELYNCKPFRNGPSAQFSRGRWVWFARQGYGEGDLEATVELAANGSTNRVEVQLLDNRQNPLPQMLRGKEF